MSESARMWVEILFNVTYLIVVWGLVAAIWRRMPLVAAGEQPMIRLFVWAFGLLALGDTGHVGFRVVAYALGGLETRITLAGLRFGLVGAGALSTAITVTFFYAIVMIIWMRRFSRPLDWTGWLLLASGGARLVLMALPGNEWNSTIPPQPWSLVRNLPLMIQGLGVAVLILRDARPAGDRLFTWIGVMILVSFAFYTPVILFVQQIPVLGMLMIPKTIAYVVIAWLAYGHSGAALPTVSQRSAV